MVKISDIAKTTGVSVSSVSRILRKDESFSATQSTIDKVLKTAEEMGYKPLRIRKPKNEAMICIFMMMSKQDEELDPYWSQIRTTIEVEALKRGLSVAYEYYVNTEGYSFKNQYKGYIVLGSISPKKLLAIGLQPENTVMIDNSTIESHGFDRVVSDLKEATARILSYLHNLGHTHIAYVGGDDEIVVNDSDEKKIMPDPRFQAFEEQMKLKNLYNPELVIIHGWNAKDGYESAKRIISLDNRPTAIVVASDPIAIGVLHALRENNISVPNEISLVSFDNIEASEYLNPPLSTIDLHDEELGRQAVLLLIQRLEGRVTPIKVVVQSDLIIRESIYNLTGGELRKYIK